MAKVIIAQEDFEAVWGKCTVCGCDVASYLCNAALIAVRPEGENWDWWMSCTNPNCEHHVGEGYDQVKPEWVDRKTAEEIKALDALENAYLTAKDCLFESDATGKAQFISSYKGNGYEVTITIVSCEDGEG